MAGGHNADGKTDGEERVNYENGRGDSLAALIRDADESVPLSEIVDEWRRRTGRV